VRGEGWPCFEEFGVPAFHVGDEVGDGAFEVGHVEILDVRYESQRGERDIGLA